MENYEEYLLLHADGELSEAEEKALEAFMALHPGVRREMELYMATKSNPDATIVFEGKERLLKKPGSVIVWAQWRTYAAAASIMLLAILAIWKWQQPNTTDITVVQVNNNNSINNNYSTAPKDTVTRKQHADEKELANVDEQTSSLRKQGPLTQMHLKAQHHAPVVMPANRQEETFASIPVSPVKPAANVAVNASPRPVDVTLPATQSPEMQESEDNNTSNALLARLPIKQEGITEIANAVNKKIDKVRNLRDNIKNTDLSVRLWNKELFVVKL